MSSLSSLTDWVTGCCLETQLIETLVPWIRWGSGALRPGEGEGVGLSVLLWDQTLGLLYRLMTGGVTGCCLGTQLIRTLIPCIRWGSGALRLQLLEERCVLASRVRLDCTRFPHYRPSVVAPGHAGPTALITADSPTLVPTLLQILPSGLLYRQSVGRCDGGGRRWGAELPRDTRSTLAPIYSRLVSLPSP